MLKQLDFKLKITNMIKSTNTEPNYHCILSNDKITLE